MERFRAPMAIVRSNLAGWKNNNRMLALAILTIILLGVTLKDAIQYGVVHDKRITIFLLPVLFTQGINSNGSFSVLFFFCSILLFCNAPFMEENKSLLVQRSGRNNWC